jgi:alpha-methylacyl-CoA racemase
VRRRIAAVFETRTRDEWVAAFAGREACFAPILDLDEARSDPHLQARRSFQLLEGVVHPTPAPRYDGVPVAVRRPPPSPGQHDREALVDWGFSSGEVDALQASGALRPT